MSGFRFFACEGCDTVYAKVLALQQCHACGEGPIEELGPGTGAAAYFTRSRGRRR